MTQYSGIAEATSDVINKVNTSEIGDHPLCSPALSVVVPEWTRALSGFEVNVTVPSRVGDLLEQIHNLYVHCEDWLVERASELDIGTMKQVDSASVLFMGLFRDLQERFAHKRNLNPHKLAVLLDGRYTVEE